MTISGVAAYSTGVDITSSDYTVVLEKPAANRTVYVEVAYNQYDPTAAGTKIFQTMTDSVGAFSIDIPTVPNGINALLRMEEFTDYFSTYERMENGKPVFTTRLNRYNFNINLNGLKPGAFEYPEKIVYAPRVIDLEDYDETVVMKGNILLAIETAFCEGAFKAAGKSDVEFEIVYNAGEADELTLTFGTTTDAEGNYAINIPAQSLTDGFSVQNIKVKGIGNNAYIHYVSEDSTSVTLSGAYQLQNIVGAAINLTDIISDMDYNLGNTYLFFTPNFNGNLTAVPNPATWHNDLAGWAIGTAGYDESYTNTIHLTGNIKLAQQTAYGKGTYVGGKQVIKLTGSIPPYDATITATTDENGNFSVAIPVQDASVNPAGNYVVELDNYQIPYTFYKKDNSTLVLKDGAYDAVNVINIIDEEAEWYELGDFYFPYLPNVANTPDDWNAYLAGWKKFQGYDKTATITGSLMFPYETAYATGAYKGANKEMVEVNVVYEAPVGVQTFAIPVSNGSFNFTIPMKNSTDQPNVAFVANDYSTTEFVNYTEYGNSSKTKMIKGKYSLYNNGTEDVIVKEDEAEWNVLGTIYYKFTPDALTPPASWHADLAGWYKKLDFEKSVVASGYAFFAVEDSFAVGHYNAAAGEVVTISVTAPYVADLQVPVSADGSFRVNVPIKNDGDECTLAAGATPVDVDDFAHYTTGGQKNTRILEGQYNPMGAPIKSDDAEWNELGEIYYAFTPDAAYKPDLWDAYFQYLAGWQRKAGYDEVVAVTGSVYYPVESSFYKGGYEGKPYHLVKLTGIGGMTYVGAADATGAFSIMVRLQFADDEPAIAWDNSDISTDIVGKFTHYRKAGSTTTVAWEGLYSKIDDIKSPTAGWNVLGARYYSFTPDMTLGYDITTAEWNYYQSLAGWRVADYAEKTTITITGTIKEAIEKYAEGSTTGSWTNAAYQKASVTVGGYPAVEVITNTSGVYSFTMKVEEVADNYTIVVKGREVEGVLAHHNDLSLAATTTIGGKFVDAGNSYASVPKSGTTFRVTDTGDGRASAKMSFTPTTTPTNWSSLSWDKSAEE